MRSTLFNGSIRPAKAITIQARKKPNGPLEPREVKAELFGVWAVHRTLDDHGKEVDDEWSVSYLPKGLAAATCMDRGTALRLAEVLQGVLNVDPWDADRHVPIAELEIKRIRGWL